MKIKQAEKQQYALSIPFREKTISFVYPENKQDNFSFSHVLKILFASAILIRAFDPFEITTYLCQALVQAHNTVDYGK